MCSSDLGADDHLGCTIYVRAHCRGCFGGVLLFWTDCEPCHGFGTIAGGGGSAAHGELGRDSHGVHDDWFWHIDGDFDRDTLDAYKAIRVTDSYGFRRGCCDDSVD